jgi:hypothetical protein
MEISDSNRHDCISVRIVNQYGNERIMPVCDTAHKLLAVCGTKTFSRLQITNIKALGYTVTAVTEAPKAL